MKTLVDLLTEFNNLGEGQVVEVDIPNIVFFKAKIFWYDGEEASVEITHQCTNSIVVEIFETIDITALEAYFRKYYANKISAFQKQIDKFDLDAQDWGLRIHNNHVAFYEMHVW